MSYAFSNTVDHKCLSGFRHWNWREVDAFDDGPVECAMRFWMGYAWSAFCLQWVAISWCAVIGREQP